MLLRLLISAAFGFGVMYTVDSYATPGAVRANGCHKNHCHSASELRTMSNGRKYVPGHFSSKRKKRRSN